MRRFATSRTYWRSIDQFAFSARQITLILCRMVLSSAAEDDKRIALMAVIVKRLTVTAAL